MCDFKAQHTVWGIFIPPITSDRNTEFFLSIHSSAVFFLLFLKTANMGLPAVNQTLFTFCILLKALHKVISNQVRLS